MIDYKRNKGEYGVIFTETEGGEYRCSGFYEDVIEANQVYERFKSQKPLAMLIFVADSCDNILKKLADGK